MTKPFTGEILFRQPDGGFRCVARFQLYGPTLQSALEDGWLRTQNIDHSWARRAGLGRDERSMMMGDRIRVDDVTWEVAMFGFERAVAATSHAGHDS